MSRPHALCAALPTSHTARYRQCGILKHGTSAVGPPNCPICLRLRTMTVGPGFVMLVSGINVTFANVISARLRVALVAA